eukprot:764170-Hanusia_phi.AAC.1
MGLKWTDLAEGVTNGGFTGYLHWDNLYGDAVIPNDLKINGNVGIGTTPSATYDLNVNGSINCTSLFLGGSALNLPDWLKYGSVVYYNGGSVGIGTNSTLYKLDVVGSINCTSLFVNGSAFGQYISSTTSDFSVSSSGQLSLTNSSSYWMTGTPPAVMPPTPAIFYGGAVSVGTTSIDASYNFVCGGNAKFTSGQLYVIDSFGACLSGEGAGPRLYLGETGNVSAYMIVGAYAGINNIDNNGSRRLDIKFDGTTRIQMGNDNISTGSILMRYMARDEDPSTSRGTNTFNTALKVIGSTWSTGIFITTSDERIKKDFVDLDDNECLNIVNQLKPRKYKYKDPIAKGTSDYVIGFIAQEVEEVLPHA